MSKENAKHTILRVRAQHRRARLTLEERRARRAALRFFQGKEVRNA